MWPTLPEVITLPPSVYHASRGKWVTTGVQRLSVSKWKIKERSLLRYKLMYRVKCRTITKNKLTTVIIYSEELVCSLLVLSSHFSLYLVLPEVTSFTVNYCQNTVSKYGNDVIIYTMHLILQCFYFVTI